jgi:hypothetical protein
MPKAAKKSKSKVTKRKRSEPDSDLIRDCVEYLAARGAADAAFQADSTDDSIHAVAVSAVHHSKASHLLPRLTARVPETRLGLRSKARVAEHFFVHATFELSGAERAFMCTFANQVADYLADEQRV